MTQLRLVHAGDLSTEAAHALEWKVGATSQRYQEIAIDCERVIGSWEYRLEWRRGRVFITSSHTEVTPRFRRKGVARSLWFAGIKRWSPTRIESQIGTDEGRDFLARMTAELSYRVPGLLLWVKRREEDESGWADRCEYEARQLLQRLGKARATAAAAKPPLKLLNGATS